MKTSQNKIRTQGIIQKKQGGDFSVKLDNGTEILATVASKFRVRRKLGRGSTRPNIIEGERVIVEIPLNQTIIKRGMIVGYQNK